MKFTDNIITKIGSDKLLHFAIGGWFTCLCSLFGIIPMIVGVVLITVLSFIKEKIFDKDFDMKDIYATLIGSAISIVIYLLSFLF